MRVRCAAVLLVLAISTVPDSSTGAAAAGSAPARFDVTTIALPGAPSDGVVLDYLAVDRPRHRVWVPAGGTGNIVVIDSRSGEVRSVGGFPTKEVERRGKKRVVGLSAATVGDGVVYLGNRADSSVCAVNARTLERGGCVTIPGSPDGLAFVAGTKEVWVTVPRDRALVILDVSKPSEPKIAGTIALEGWPEGYAVDEGRGVFYTNLEDTDRTLRIDVRTRKLIATWMPACGEAGPRGLAIDPEGRLLVVACPDHVEVLRADGDGAILSKLDIGTGVDNIDYLPPRRALYVAAGGAGTLTIAHLDQKGVLTLTASAATAEGARNAVATEDGAAFVANGSAGRVLVVRPRERE